MIRPDKGKFPVTQYFGEHPEWYQKFGIRAHNGWDIGCPTGTTLVSPITGTVTEIAEDPTGYGLYVKIESDSEGTLLAHNQQILVQLGQHIDEGQSVALSNNTGNSTGPHSHWGYFRTPRDRTNGYNGYIDPLPYLTEESTIPPMVFNDQTKIPKELLGEDQDLEIQQIRGLLKDGKRDNLDLQNVRVSLKECQSRPPEVVKTADLSQVSRTDLLIAIIKKIFP